MTENDRKENDRKINEQLDKAFWDLKPVSATDCTGLVQGSPIDNEVTDTAAKMYNIASGSNEDVMRIGPDSGADSRDKSKDSRVVEP